MNSTAGKESVFISGLEANITEADIKGEPFFRLTFRLFEADEPGLRTAYPAAHY